LRISTNGKTEHQEPSNLHHPTPGHPVRLPRMPWEKKKKEGKKKERLYLLKAHPFQCHLKYIYVTNII